jgi:hypothetical protein
MQKIKLFIALFLLAIIPVYAYAVPRTVVSELCTSMAG